LIFDLVVFTVVFLLLVIKRISLELRAAVVLLITFLIGIVVICQIGFVSGGTAWLFCFSVLTGVLMGLRAALIAVALNAVAMIALAWMTRNGLIGDLGYFISNGRAVTAIANFLLLNAVCAVTVAVLVNGLEAFNKRIQSATRALRKEQRNLLAARESLKQEVAERKDSEQAALLSERKYRLLAENIRDVIWTMDTDLKFTYVSPAVTQMLEWTAAEFLELTLEQIMTPDSFKEAVDLYEQQYEFGERTGDFNWSTMMELELYTKSGASVWTEVTAGFLLGADARPVGILGAARDITDRLRAQKEKEELLESLSRSRKMEALGTLAGGVAHDLNNVLSGIVSYPDLLLMDMPDDSPLRQPIETMRNSGKKAAAIVQDLLTLARRNVSVCEVTNLNELVREYLSSPEFKRLKSYHPLVEMDIRLAPNLSHILGSTLHLFKSLMNLVSNAAEAMPEGGRLTISTENCHFDKPFIGYTKIPEGDYSLLKVSDTGIGISSEDINRIFEPFYSKKKMGRSGTGLGMAVVWGTVQDHNAFIDIESASGRGTVIALYLPVTDGVIANATEPTAIEDHRGAGESVLVVDDVKEQREVATRILEQLGYRALSASCGEEAVIYLEKNSVDLMLLDMIMDPGIDGLQTYKQILKHHPYQRAIITSGYAETKRVKEAQRLGAGGYLKKPYTVENLGKAIRNELRR
jgi:PAS domain S-box-containing protein